jgi:hypothetical protein
MKLLGHASLETAAIYTEMNVESRRQVFSCLSPCGKTLARKAMLNYNPPWSHLKK